MLNLINDPWLPVLRQSGTRCVIAPADITAALNTDPIVGIDWPRPDFRVATMEFLVGLLATACPPQDHDHWLDGWESPPEPATLAASFAPFAHAFELDGDGPRFLQDFDDLVSDAEPVERLLIDSPGGSTISKNTDVLVHRGRVTSLCRATAAIALYTFQSWAPSGGAGNRTGLRGGGPLVTMAVPSGSPSLWHVIWANVPRGSPPRPDDLPRVFPWLVPTITSKDARVVTPETAHPLQCWWGMPRRIRLDFTTAEPARGCDLTGTPDTVAVVSWRQRPHGANYAAWGQVHPLTPVYQLKAASEVLPLHPQPGGIGYRHWLSLVVNPRDELLAKGQNPLRLPAPAVVTWREKRAPDLRQDGRLLAAGFDMDNMKARGFVETEMPLPAPASEEGRDRIDRLAARLVGAAEQVAGLLRAAVRNALFSAGATVRIEAEALSALRERLWAQTEPAFFDALERAAQRDGVGPEDEEERRWQQTLRRVALALFDEAAPMEPDAVPLVRQGETVPRQVRARRNLLFALQGFGKDGAALFTVLGLPAAQAKTSSSKSSAAKSPRKGRAA